MLCEAEWVFLSMIDDIGVVIPLAERVNVYNSLKNIEIKIQFVCQTVRRNEVVWWANLVCVTYWLRELSVVILVDLWLI